MIFTIFFFSTTLVSKWTSYIYKYKYGMRLGIDGVAYSGHNVE